MANTRYIPKLTIRDRVYFGKKCYVSCLNSITISSGATFGDNVMVNDNLHGDSNELGLESRIHPMDRKLYSKGPFFVGEIFWVEKNICVFGVSIGSGTIIGANRVVTHDSQQNAIYAGVPAKRIK